MEMMRFPRPLGACALWSSVSENYLWRIAATLAYKV